GGRRRSGRGGPASLARVADRTLLQGLKQNLRIKTFVGTSANALKVQIWTVLIAMLILKYLQLKARFAWSLSNLVALRPDRGHGRLNVRMKGCRPSYCGA